MAESKGKDDQKLKKDKDKNTTQDSILAIQTQIENIRNSMPDDKKAKLAAQRRITSLQDRILTLRQSITEEGSTMLPQIRARLALAKPRRVHSAQFNDEEMHTIIVDWFRKNPNPDDPDVHELAGKLGVEPEALEKVIYRAFTRCVQSSMQEVAADEQDIICLDVPLFIRTLEYVREEVKSDDDLHRVAEKFVKQGHSGTRLTMNDGPGLLTTARVKGDDEYNWYTYTGTPLKFQSKAGTAHTISKGGVFGIRPSSSGKQIRLVFKDLGLTKVFTISDAELAKLQKAAKVRK